MADENIPTSYSGLQKAAILLRSLGDKEAAEVLKLMGPKEVQKIGAGAYVKKPYTLEKIGTAVKTELTNKSV